MKDYNVTVKIRNNYLLTAMRQKGCETIADLHRLSGVSQANIGYMLNLKITPMTKKGEWRKPVVEVAKTLGRDPTELFPAQHLNVTLETNTAESEMSIEEIGTLMLGVDGVVPEHLMLPDEIAEREESSQVLLDIVNNLPGREPEILKMRFGLENYKEHTLEWIGNYFGVSKDRIRQIEAKALRRLRHPTRNTKLKVTGYGIEHGYRTINVRAEEAEQEERENQERWEAGREDRERLEAEQEEQERLEAERLAHHREEVERIKWENIRKAGVKQLPNRGQKGWDDWSKTAQQYGHRT